MNYKDVYMNITMGLYIYKILIGDLISHLTQMNLGGKTEIHTMNHITSGFLTTITWCFSRIYYMVHFQNDRREACLCQSDCLVTISNYWSRTLSWKICHFLQNPCFLFTDFCLHYPHNAVTFDAIWSSLDRFREMPRANVNDAIWSTYVMWIARRTMQKCVWIAYCWQPMCPCYLHSCDQVQAFWVCGTGSSRVNTFKPRQIGSHFADDIFKCIFLKENEWISLQISPKCIPKFWINSIPALVQIMAWRRPGGKPLSEAMMVSFLTHICVTWPQLVKHHISSVTSNDI